MSPNAAGKARTTLLWGWSVLVLILTVSVLIASDMSHPRNDPAWALPVYMLLPGLFTVLGATIAIQQPGNRIASLFLFMGACLLVTVWADFRVGLAAPTEPTLFDALAVVWFDAGYHAGIFVPLGLLLHIFPTGKVLGSRWKWAWWAAGISAMATVLAEISVSEVSPNLSPDLQGWSIPNPVGLAETGTAAYGPYAVVLGLTFLPLMIGGVVSVVLRYRRSDLTVRAQIRWVVLALILMVVAGIVPALFGYYGANLFIALGFIPVAVTIAITRYRLFDIDKLISRTVGYAIVVGLLAAVFVLATTLPSLVIGGVDSEGESASAPPLLVAASTLAVAALFDPLRRRVLGWVDRRFNRSHYDAERVVGEFGDRLRDETDPATIVAEAVATVVDALEPSSVALWVRETEAGQGEFN